MLKRSRISVVPPQRARRRPAALPLALVLACLGLAGCGQKGPLTLPKPTASPATTAKAPAPAASGARQGEPGR